MLIPSSYLPPVAYVSRVAASETAWIDGKEHFIKQTIRNRCHILSPNGIQPLIIPVIHNDRSHQQMESVSISNDHPWQRQHWRSILAAYRRSAYFEFYADEFEPFYLQKHESLLQFNTEILMLILKLTGINARIRFSEKFDPYGETSPHDLRAAFNTGTPIISPDQRKYPQVFESKFGFTPGLSIIDLLFSLGPATREHLLLGRH
jgi:hypothetical protein